MEMKILIDEQLKARRKTFKLPTFRQGCFYMNYKYESIASFNFLVLFDLI
jgi:hypothetical protein